MFGARLKQSLLAVLVTAATVAGSATFIGSPVQAASPDSGTSNAFGIHVALLGGDVVARQPFATLPADGAPVTLTQTLPVNVPGLISVNTLNASVSSQNFGSPQEQIMAAAGTEGIAGGGSALLGVSLLNLLNIGAVQSDCTSSASGSVGGTSIANLTIGNGTPINLPNDTTAPNTGLTAAELGPLAGLVTIVLNKQTVTNAPGNTSIQVIGVEITLLGALDHGLVIDISQAFCQATGPDIEAPPSITSVTPHAGPVAGGTPVTITGVDFQTTPTPTVDFGANPATSVVVVSPTEITAVSPPASNQTANTTVAVSTSNQFGTSTTTPNAGNSFTYEVGPPLLAITGLTPNTGPVAGGTFVTIAGANFGPDSTVSFCVPTTTTCAPATRVTYVSPTQITAFSPASQITTAGGAGPENVTVTDAGGTTAPQTFTYFVPVVTVTSVTPDAGPVSHATPITIDGTGFGASSTVAFCTPLSVDTTCTPATSVSDATSASPSTILTARTRLRPSRRRPPTT